MSIWSKAKTFFLGALLTLVGVGAAGPVDMDPVVAEAAEGPTTITLVGMSGSSDEVTTFKQGTDGKWDNDYVTASVLNNSGNQDSTKVAYIRQEQLYTFSIQAKTNYTIDSILLVEASGNKGNFGGLTFNNATGSYSGDNYLVTPTDGGAEITSYYEKGSMLRYTAEITLTYEEVEMGPIVDVEVTTPPTKVDYYVGDTFSLDGLVLTGYDAAGNSKIIPLDDEKLTLEYDEGHVFTADEKTEGKDFLVYYYAESLITVTPTWTITVSDRPEAVEYSYINKESMYIGTTVTLGVVDGNAEYYLSEIDGSTAVMSQETLTVDSSDGKLVLDPSATLAVDFTIRMTDFGDSDTLVIALYNEETGYVGYGSSGTSLKFNDTLSANYAWTVVDSGDSYYLRNYGATSRYLGLNDGDDEIKAYSTSNLNQYPHAHLYAFDYDDPSEAAMNEAIELSRYVMESDTDWQCKTKFYVARDAYINRMTDEGREWFQIETDAWARYLAWATYLGENIDTPTKVEAYRPFTSNNEDLSWIIAVSLLGVASVAGLTYYFIRRKKRA